MRTVDSKQYDRKYFEEAIHTTIHEFKNGKNPMLDKIGNLLPLKESDLVVDFGCGSGLLSFSLHERYHCRVVGIDYSEDAISLCNEYNRTLQYKKVSFLKSDIAAFPNMEDVRGIFFADVIEHLYDEEIDALFEKVNSWELGSEHDFYVVIHTDNLNYLRYVRWFIDSVSLILRRTSISNLKGRNDFEKARHVNLMTLSSLTKRMNRYGYRLKRVEYPEITEEGLKSQLGPLGSAPLMAYMLRKSYNLIKYLSPSFYCLFVRKT